MGPGLQHLNDLYVSYLCCLSLKSDSKVEFISWVSVSGSCVGARKICPSVVRIILLLAVANLLLLSS